MLGRFLRAFSSFVESAYEIGGEGKQEKFRKKPEAGSFVSFIHILLQKSLCSYRRKHYTEFI
jgi:hypothetical protein